MSIPHTSDFRSRKRTRRGTEVRRAVLPGAVCTVGVGVSLRDSPQPSDFSRCISRDTTLLCRSGEPRAYSIAHCGLRVNTVARFPRRGRGKVVQDCGPDPSRSRPSLTKTVALLCKDSAWLPPTEMVKLTTWDTSHGSGRADSFALFGGSWCSCTHQSNCTSPDRLARLCRGAGGAAPCVTSYKNKNTQRPVASSAAQPRYELGKRN
jgi:hypothetical protein